MPTTNTHSPTGSDPRLADARRAIDALDDELLALIERRFALSAEVAALKQADDGHLRIRPKREAEVLARLTARATTATPELIAHVWRELMAHSVQAQVPTTLVLHAPAAAVSGLGAGMRERFGRAAALHAWRRARARRSTGRATSRRSRRSRSTTAAGGLICPRNRH